MHWSDGQSVFQAGLALNELRVFAARSRRRSSVGRTRWLGEDVWPLWRFHPGRLVPRWTIAGRSTPPEEHNCRIMVGSGVVGWSADHLSQGETHGLRRRQWISVACWGTRQQHRVAVEADGANHGPIACWRVSVRMKISRP
jgi:hypothetical protein